jgi:hypothetical protein
MLVTLTSIEEMLAKLCEVRSERQKKKVRKLPLGFQGSGFRVQDLGLKVWDVAC